MINKTKETSKNSGITLVALVVTIVVLIILAGVSISLILENNGIINKAKLAKGNYEYTQVEEQNTLNNASDWMDKKLNNKNDYVEEQDILPKTDTTKPFLPIGFNQVEGTNLDNGLTIKYNIEDYYVWVEVPMTTTVYPTAGLSITSFTDDEYKKIEDDLHAYTSTIRDGTTFTDTWSSKDHTGLDETEYYNLKKSMLKSVYMNGGFWVSKYEIGDSTSTNNNTTRNKTTGANNKPIISENQQPYDLVTCYQAESLAKQLNPNSSRYETNLMFGVQWDLVLKYIQSKNKTEDDIITNSIEWGNYRNVTFDISNGKYSIIDETNWALGTWNNISDKFTKGIDKSVILSTGISKRNMKQNIYDLAGNVWEWTLEYSNDSTKPAVYRGANYADDERQPVSLRSNNIAEYCGGGVGFRTCLYRK